MENIQTKIFSDILSEKELDILVRYFAKVIIAHSPIYSVLTGGNEAGRTKMIWGRGELIFALHHRYVNLTSKEYLNNPLRINSKQKLQVGWNMVLPKKSEPLTKEEYWLYFKRFMSQEFYLSFAHPDDRLFHFSEEQIEEYMGLAEGGNKTTVLDSVTSKRIETGRTLSYTLFERYGTAKNLLEYLDYNIGYIKETLAICWEVEQTTLHGAPSLILNDDQLFLIYIHFLHCYYQAQTHDEFKHLSGTYCPDKLIALFHEPEAQSQVPKGLGFRTYDKFLLFHQWEKTEEGHPVDMSKVDINRVHAIQTTLNLTQQTASSERKNWLCLLFISIWQDKPKSGYGWVMPGTALFVTAAVGIYFYIQLKESQRRGMENQSENKAVKQEIRQSDSSKKELAQELQRTKLLVRDTTRINQYFIRQNNPLLLELVERKKSSILRKNIQSTLYKYQLVPDQPDQPVINLGQKHDSLLYCNVINAFGESEKDINRQVFYLIHRYAHKSNLLDSPNIYGTPHIKGSKLNSRANIDISKLIASLRDNKQAISGTYIVLAFVDTSAVIQSFDFDKLKNQIQATQNGRKMGVTLNINGLVATKGFMAFDIIDQAEN